MIFYFSGTGNSQHIAKAIAEAQKTRLVSVAEEAAKGGSSIEYALAEGEILGFVFPVHAWGPPKIVLDLISRMSIKGEAPFAFSVCTCGGEEGDTTRLLQKSLARKGLKLDCAFTVKMPNNYILGYDVDPPAEEASALKAAEGSIAEINEVLGRRQAGVYHLIKGKSPAIKTALIHPLFNRFAISTKSFFATEACTGCGLCERVCPVHTITVKDRPSWGAECTQCLACINRCPVRAIQYGKGTIAKGRYLHPDLR